MAITIFTLFVFYTIACCMDGPDLKPLWKRWLGSRLEMMAAEFKPIERCTYERCRFYLDSKYQLPMYKERYEEILKNVAMINNVNSRPIIVTSDYDIKKIEQGFFLSEGELHRARLNEQMAASQCVPLCELPFNETVDGIVSRTKERCVYSVLDSVKPFITLEEDRESHYPDIIVRGTLHVGVKKKIQQ